MSEKVSVKVVNMQGKEVESLDLDAAIFGCDADPHLVHQVVTWQLTKRRAGTHSTKTKGDIGEKTKPWKQKGTGRARAGSNVSPLWVGGGVAHGPKPRDYTKRLAKRTRRQALCSVLSEKLRTSSLVVVDKFSIDSGKTSDMAKTLDKIGVSGKKAVIVAKQPAAGSDKGDGVWRSSKNISGVLPLQVEGVNVYDLLRHQYLVMSRDSLSALTGRINGDGKVAATKEPKAKKASAKKAAKAK